MLLGTNVFAAKLPVNIIGVSVRNVSSVTPFGIVNGVPCKYVSSIVFIYLELMNLHRSLYENKQEYEIVSQGIGELQRQQLGQAKSPFLFLSKESYPGGDREIKACNDVTQLRFRLNQCRYFRLSHEKQRQDEVQPPFKMDL